VGSLIFLALPLLCGYYFFTASAKKVRLSISFIDSTNHQSPSSDKYSQNWFELEI
jgi:hypothetical protein